MRITAALLVAIPALLAAQQPLRVGPLTMAAPITLAELDMGRLKGEPSRLAWSPDASQLYVQTLEGGFGRPNVKLRHYLLLTAKGSHQEVQVEPDWASEYWTAKSGQTSPDGHPLTIELKTDKRLERTTSVPRGGDLARGGTTTQTGTSVDDGVTAAYNSQTVIVHSMVLKGETLGEFVNSVIVPGLSFGWGPKGTRVIAFAAQKTGRVVVMDEQGHKHEVAESKDAILPAWSPDGSRLAWLEKEGRRKFLLRVAGVSGF